MKAIKHSPEWFGPRKDKDLKDKKGNPIDFTPWSLMGVGFHVHTVGYTADGKRYEGHAGKGPTTLFYRIEQKITSQEDAQSRAQGIYNILTNAGKLERRSGKIAQQVEAA